MNHVVQNGSQNNSHYGTIYNSTHSLHRFSWSCKLCWCDVVCIVLSISLVAKVPMTWWTEMTWLVMFFCKNLFGSGDNINYTVSTFHCKYSCSLITKQWNAWIVLIFLIFNRLYCRILEVSNINIFIHGFHYFIMIHSKLPNNIFHWNSISYIWCIDVI